MGVAMFKFDDFVDYVNSFYGDAPDVLYPMGVSKDVVRSCCMFYVRKLSSADKKLFAEIIKDRKEKRKKTLAMARKAVEKDPKIKKLKPYMDALNKLEEEVKNYG
jgi:hypothetical protein